MRQPILPPAPIRAIRVDIICSCLAAGTTGLPAPHCATGPQTLRRPNALVLVELRRFLRRFSSGQTELLRRLPEGALEPLVEVALVRESDVTGDLRDREV